MKAHYLCLLLLCVAAIKFTLSQTIPNQRPRIFFGGHFDQRTKPQVTPFYGVGIWDDQYSYWFNLEGGLDQRTLTSNYSTTYQDDEIYASYFDNPNGDLYIGGLFSVMAGINSPSIVRYNLNNDTWHSISSSCDGTIFSIADTGAGIVVGGTFQNINSVNTGGLALLTKSTGAWSSIGGVVVGTVKTLIVYNNLLFVGGNITSVGNLTVAGIAVYNLDTNQWSIPGSICDGLVTSFSVIDDKLYIAGTFTSFANNNESCPSGSGASLAEYDLINQYFTNTFQFTNDTFKGTITVLTSTSKGLFIGGDFTKINSAYWPGFVFYNTSSGEFSPIIPPQFGIPFSGELYAVASTPGFIFFGGYFVGPYWGVVRLDINSGIWNSLDSGLACTICPEIGNNEVTSSKRVPWVYTVSVLSPGPPRAPSSDNIPQPSFPGKLVGSTGKWEEYNIPPYPGSSVFYQNDTDFLYSTVGSSRPRSFYWQTWSVVGAAIFIGSLFLAIALNTCVKSVTRY